jgi:hypothetical protein
MGRIKKTLTELLSYEPSREQIVMILKEVKETGKSIEEIADRYSLPPIFILESKDSLLDYNGEMISQEDFKRRFPFRRFVVIT